MNPVRRHIARHHGGVWLEAWVIAWLLVVLLLAFGPQLWADVTAGWGMTP